MAIDFSSIVNFLEAISSISVILGAVFVVFQLRQNAKLIQLQVSQNRSNIALALMDTLTSESFAARRKKMHETVKAAVASNWKDFDDSLEDYEARNFAYIYELIALLALQGVVDLELLRSAMQYLVVWDWEAFSPLSRHLMEIHKLSVHPWENFEWLAEQSRQRMIDREKERQAKGNGKEDSA
jgi:hypothetical protein